ncbi:MAG: hypothetical protein J6B86_04045 [Clostridia bacterium]|nr:hypothetical protein [Clostridia bacterium]
MRPMIQKILCPILILSIAACLSACGETEVFGDSETQNSNTIVSSDSETEQWFDSVTNTSSETDETSSTDGSSDSDTDISSAELPSDSETEQATDSQNTDTATDTDTKTETSTDNRPSNTETVTDTVTDTSTATDLPSSTDSSDTVSTDTKPEDTPEESVQTDISPIDPENYFGIRWLAKQSNGSNLVKTYRELVAGAEKLQEEIPLSAGISEQELNTVWYCFQADYPQYFWLGDRFEYYHQNDKVTKVVPAYIVTKEDLPKAQKSFDSAAKRLLAGINASMTQYEIEKVLHDRIVLHCNYREAENAHNAYGALVNGAAVCEGITKAFQHLCRSVGIETLFVFGKSSNPTTGVVEGHAWNIVKIDKSYYHVDVTWDNAGEPTEDEMHYTWFNLPTQWITEDHVLEQLGYTYPNCTETKENFFVKTDGRLSALSIEGVVKRAIKHGDEYFFRAYLTHQADPYQWMQENAGALAKKLGLNGYEYKIITVGHEVTIVMSDYKG